MATSKKTTSSKSITNYQQPTQSCISSLKDTTSTTIKIKNTLHPLSVSEVKSRVNPSSSNDHVLLLYCFLCLFYYKARISIFQDSTRRMQSMSCFWYLFYIIILFSRIPLVIIFLWIKTLWNCQDWIYPSSRKDFFGLLIQLYDMFLNLK